MVLPSYVLQRHKDITLCVDFLYVQGNIFLLSLSREIYFSIGTAVDDRSDTTKVEVIKEMMRLYTQRGVVVRHIVGNQEFKSIADKLLPAVLETVTTDDHFSDVERDKRDIKEGIRCLVQSLSYNCYPITII